MSSSPSNPATISPANGTTATDNAATGTTATDNAARTPPQPEAATPPLAPIEPAAAPTCSQCREPAVEQIRYAGVHHCREHFLEFVRRRVKKELRKQGGFPTGVRVGVAVSGGKDSIVALRLVHETLAPRLCPDEGGHNPQGDASLVVVTIDEGIAGYRETGLEIARATAAELGLPHHILSYQELVGATMDETSTVKEAQNECAFCGVFRRAAMNKVARAAGCDVLVTGHNLDDTSQAVLMNVTGGDVARLGRLGPHTEAKADLVPRRMPLREIPEKEIYLFAMLQGWRIDHAECPYARNSQRFLYRDLLAKMERANPGTRHSLLRTLDTLKPMLAAEDGSEASSMGRCAVCGEPASGDTCKTCQLGATVRTRLAAKPS